MSKTRKSWTPGPGSTFRERLLEREILTDVTAHLAAAISLLERGSKKVAPSDKMFDMMLNDYRASLERARAFLNSKA